MGRRKPTGSAMAERAPGDLELETQRLGAWCSTWLQRDPPGKSSKGRTAAMTLWGECGLSRKAGWHLSWNVDHPQGDPQIDDRLEKGFCLLSDRQGACAPLPPAVYVENYGGLLENTRTLAPRRRENPRRALVIGLISSRLMWSCCFWAPISLGACLPLDGLSIP